MKLSAVQAISDVLEDSAVRREPRDDCELQLWNNDLSLRYTAGRSIPNLEHTHTELLLTALGSWKQRFATLVSGRFGFTEEVFPFWFMSFRQRAKASSSDVSIAGMDVGPEARSIRALVYLVEGEVQHIGWTTAFAFLAPRAFPSRRSAVVVAALQMASVFWLDKFGKWQRDMADGRGRPYGDSVLGTIDLVIDGAVHQIEATGDPN